MGLIENLHFECETHFRIDTASKYLQHQLYEVLFKDALLKATPRGNRVESVADNSRQIDVFKEGDLVDGPLIGLRRELGWRHGAESQVRENS